MQNSRVGDSYRRDVNLVCGEIANHIGKIETGGL